MNRFETRNIQFVNDLVKDAVAGHHFKFSRVQGGDAYDCILPVESTGLDLLKAFVRMERHANVNEAKSRRDLEYRVKLQEQEQERRIKIYCRTSQNEPGYGWISGDRYTIDESTVETLTDFANYFSDFLRVPMTEKWCDGSDDWKLSVLLVFEIARRTTEEDHHEFYNLPVAAGIQMAMEIPQCPTTVLFNLFKGERYDRNDAFQNIFDRWTGGSMNLFQSESVTMLNTSLESRMQNQISFLFEENQNLREQVKALKEEFNDLKKPLPQPQDESAESSGI